MRPLPAVFSYRCPEWLALRRRALIRALWRCEMCGASVHGKHRARVDHIVPVRENARLAWDMANLRVLCVDCDAARHAEKGNRLVERENIGLDGYPTKGV